MLVSHDEPYRLGYRLRAFFRRCFALLGEWVVGNVMSGVGLSRETEKDIVPLDCPSPLRIPEGFHVGPLIFPDSTDRFVS